MIKINKDDKAMIKAYVKWCLSKGFKPDEYEISKLMDNWNTDHRFLVEEYINNLVDQATENRL